MVERRYGFRFSGLEGMLLVVGALVSSFLIFVSGVYVGREVAGRKTASPIQTVRIPVSPSPDESLSLQRVAKNGPLEWPTRKEESLSSIQGVERGPLQENVPQKVETGTIKVSTTRVEQKSTEKNIASEKVEPKIIAKKEPATAATANKRPTKNEVSGSAQGRTPEMKSVTAAVVRSEKTNESTSKKRMTVSEIGNRKSEKVKEANPEFDVGLKQEKKVRNWQVQIGATIYQETAQDMARELRTLGYNPFVIKVQRNGETLYRVRVGKFPTQDEAMNAVGRFRREGRFSQAYIVSD